MTLENILTQWNEALEAASVEMTLQCAPKLDGLSVLNDAALQTTAGLSLRSGLQAGGNAYQPSVDVC